MSTLPPLHLSTPLDRFVLVWGGLNLLVALYSLRASFRYRAYVRGMSRRPPGPEGDRFPEVTLVVPCCGDEEGLAGNVDSLLDQDYPSFHTRFVVESSADGAVHVLETALARHPDRGSLVVAGRGARRGQKVHNLLAALDSAPMAEVLVFADSDGRVDRTWLKTLVSPLEQPNAGAASSYRFYLPEPASFPALLRSAWNASVLTLLGEHDHNFAWGGATAIRRTVFERIGVREAWNGALSDDYALTHAVRRAGLRIEFVPGALVGSGGDVSLRGLATWCARQIAITRVYWPALFRVTAATQILYGSFLLVAPFTANASLLALLGVVLLLGFWSGGVRARSIAELAPRWRGSISKHFWAYVLLVPLSSFLTLAGVLRAIASRRIEWRGRVYEMLSPTETRIVVD
jgi:cellulose synthase/poly-beta-1,6-N-acetylglucosamine synthase-like glycosyltransferase